MAGISSPLGNTSRIAEDLNALAAVETAAPYRSAPCALLGKRHIVRRRSGNKWSAMQMSPPEAVHSNGGLDLERAVSAVMLAGDGEDESERPNDGDRGLGPETGNYRLETSDWRPLTTD